MVLKIFQKSKKKRVYLDYAAATPVDSRVKSAMEPYWCEEFGNAGAVHREGVSAKKALNEARGRSAAVLHARPEEIIFTSGGTEANNLAIFGLFKQIEKTGKKLEEMHVITTAIEHPSILECFKELERLGVSVTYLGVTREGIIDIKKFHEALKTETVFVSIMYANNEIGTIQPVAQVGKIIKEVNEKNTSNRIFFHTDASQAPLFIDCSVERLNVDLLTLDGQKMYGPKGVGILYKKRNVEITPLLIGGNQEHSLRPGTENIPLVVGFSVALEIANREREHLNKKLAPLRDIFFKKVKEQIPNVEINGSLTNRLANNINISLPGVDGEYFLSVLDTKGIAASTRSACMGHEGGGSYVVGELGKGKKFLTSSIRFSMGRETTQKDMDYVLATLNNYIKKVDK